MSQINVDIIRSRTGTAATCDKGLVVSGVTTASGGVVGDVTGTLTGTATGLSGSPNITVTDVTAQNITAVGATFTGTVSYENIQNLDSVGMVTARAGLNVGHLTGIAATIDIGGNISCGIITASSFDGVISGVDIKSGGSFLGAGVTDINFASGATITNVNAGVSTITIAAGITTATTGNPSGITSTLYLSDAQDHKANVTGFVTFTCSGGSEGDSHTLRITNVGVATVGFSTYFLWPAGSVPSMPTASGAISLISFTVQRVGAGGTQLLAGASLDFS